VRRARGRWAPRRARRRAALARLTRNLARLPLQLNAGPGGNPKIIPEDNLDTNTLSILRQLKAQAITSWWKQAHPGWSVFRCGGPGLLRRLLLLLLPGVVQASLPTPALLLLLLRPCREAGQEGPPKLDQAAMESAAAAAAGTARRSPTGGFQVRAPG
jgi:hypothetical protein